MPAVKQELLGLRLAHALARMGEVERRGGELQGEQARAAEEQQALLVRRCHRELSGAARMADSDSYNAAPSMVYPARQKKYFDSLNFGPGR